MSGRMLVVAVMVRANFQQPTRPDCMLGSHSGHSKLIFRTMGDSVVSATYRLNNSR